MEENGQYTEFVEYYFWCSFSVFGGYKVQFTYDNLGWRSLACRCFLKAELNTKTKGNGN